MGDKIAHIFTTTFKIIAVCLILVSFVPCLFLAFEIGDWYQKRIDNDEMLGVLEIVIYPGTLALAMTVAHLPIFICAIISIAWNRVAAMLK
jgi:hypothetical protein